jgi:hypothetical protein
MAPLSRAQLHKLADAYKTLACVSQVKGYKAQLR